MNNLFCKYHMGQHRYALLSLHKNRRKPTVFWPPMYWQTKKNRLNWLA